MADFDREALPEVRTYLDEQQLKAVGRGKWVSTECRLHGGSDSLRWNTGTGGWVCMACGAKGGNVLDYHMQANGLDFVTAARELGALVDGKASAARFRAPPPVVRMEPEQRTVLSDTGSSLWRSSLPLSNTAGESYLKARNCVVPPRDSHLRFHPSLRHPTGYEGPALLALVTDAKTRRPKTLHRTWIRGDGTKADVKPSRLLLGGHEKQGGVIRLWHDECVTYGLGIAEGVETALSLAHAYTPVWACIDAGNLGQLPHLAGIRTLVIAADRDAAGEKGAQDCAERWATAGVDVLITRQHQNDLNDLVQEAA